MAFWLQVHATSNVDLPRRLRPLPHTATASHHLTPPQVAFVRCWAEGLDLVASWNRYLAVQGAADARRARGELQRLLDRLRGVALAQGRRDVAVLLRRDPEAIAEHGAAAPSLDEFRAQHPADFYSEAELVGLYQAEHGALPSRSPGRRRQRLRARLLAALQWLESASVRAPSAGEPVNAWLDERVAQRLAVVGIRTLGDLHGWVCSKGFHWHRAVPRLGAEGAARIVRWLDEHQATLGALPAAARVPRRSLDAAALTPPARTGIVPLERFIPPPGLDGARGTNRAPAQAGPWAAPDDLAAVQAWLQQWPAGTHTWRAYRKETERFLLWAVMLQRKPLSSLDGADCAAYRDFLAAPGPAWTGPRSTPRHSDAWRPFEGPLSARSRQQALVIVRSLCGWLARHRYLDANPWDGVQARSGAANPPPLRALSTHQWSLVQTWLGRESARAPSPALHRLRFVLVFAYLTGLRLSELVACVVGGLRQTTAADGSQAWLLQVVGKRGKAREIPLPAPAMACMQDYFASRALDTRLLINPPDTPLIAHLERNEPLSATRLYEVLVHGFERCAAEWQEHDRRAAETIREASTHWLRHSHGAQALADGVPQRILQVRLGHESPAATAVYARHQKRLRA